MDPNRTIIEESFANDNIDCSVKVATRSYPMDTGMTTKYGQCKVNICKHIDKGKGNRLSVSSCGFIKSGICCVLRKETANQIKEGSLLIKGASDYDRDRGLARREIPESSTQSLLRRISISISTRQQDRKPLCIRMAGVIAPTTLNSHATSVTKLNGTNFSEWKEQVEFTLGVLELDMALLKDKPAPLTETSTAEEKNLFNAWEKSDRLSTMFLRMTIATNIKTSLPKPENAKDYMKAIQDRFKTADKSLAGKLMADLTTMKFDGTRSMHEHVIEMTNLAANLKNLGLSVDEAFLVQFILNSLPPQYGPFQIHYNTITDKWTVNELANKLVQEEARLNQQGIKLAHLVQGAGHKAGKKYNSGQKRAPPRSNEAGQHPKKKKKENVCKFCKKPGHFQADCIKRKEWFEKKGNPMGFVSYFESNLTHASSNTWWIDTGANVHVSNTM
ncbi:Retrovirus-related Pol polyprotein from transposon TNT 1-94 [Cinnamomum micranthum f. kanehirae]|uniref:Retrovirus-related Pol polyprotein from transposon TNT 1-94 n=1 Tax=Cinnamomum micranthum f. kanehirae TaxID=337451 RepID=A0A3S3PPD8_9MAGN|nr:Retrovirus-related Pol polyprotein from transposon TNT 1-94 [Cinnamomum micranthum f. kanehirae]